MDYKLNAVYIDAIFFIKHYIIIVLAFFFFYKILRFFTENAEIISLDFIISTF